MEVKEMKELIAAVSSANVDEFEYNNEEFSIRIAKKKAKIATVDASVAGVPLLQSSTNLLISAGCLVLKGRKQRNRKVRLQR